MTHTVSFHLIYAVFAAGATVKLPQHKNETTPDMHHIIVITGEQFSSDRALLMWNSICSCTFAWPRTLSAPP